MGLREIMETSEHDKIIAFDTLYTNNHIQMLKIVMPYFDKQTQGKLAVYIKYLEFRHTLDHCSHSYELSGCSFQKEDFNINKLCSELSPFCSNSEKEKLERIAGIFRSIEMYKEMSRTMEMMKDFAPDLFADGLGSIFPPNSATDSPDGNDANFSDGNATVFPDVTGYFSSQANQQNNNMMEMLMGMLSPEQKSIFEMFGGNNTHESDRMDE
ncbi:hypothetical protein D3Z45_16745 [Lachnospiraceae bacterium]|nr:hypothetical protein [Lachnospiraceae bacterium]